MPTFLRCALDIAIGASALGIAACSTSSTSQDEPVPQFTIMQDALDGTFDEETDVAVDAAIHLAGAIDAADWFYLSNATLPSDAGVLLADPRMQKALVALGTTASTQSMGSLKSPTLHLEGNGVTPNMGSVANVQAVLDQLLPLLKAHGVTVETGEGAVSLENPAVLAAFVYVVERNLAAVPLPSPGAPMDPATDQKTVTFFKGGGALTTTQHFAPCCVGTLSFLGGNAGSTFQCADSTSCQGKGEPANGTYKVGPAPGGGGPDAGMAGSTTCCFNTQSGSVCTPIEYCCGLTYGVGGGTDTYDYSYLACVNAGDQATCSVTQPLHESCCASAGGTILASPTSEATCPG